MCILLHYLPIKHLSEVVWICVPSLDNPRTVGPNEDSEKKTIHLHLCNIFALKRVGKRIVFTCTPFFLCQTSSLFCSCTPRLRSFYKSGNNSDSKRNSKSNNNSNSKSNSNNSIPVTSTVTAKNFHLSHRRPSKARLIYKTHSSPSVWRCVLQIKINI